MNWAEQAEALMRTWTDAQKKVWEGWYDLARNAPGMRSETGMPDGSDPMGWLRDGMGAWTRAAGETGQGAVGNIFTSQTAMMRSLELLTRAWQTVAPKMEAGKDWKPDLKAFTDDWIRQIAAAGAMGGIGEPNKQLEAFLGDWAPLLKPWLASMGENAATGHLGGAMLGGTEGLNRLLNLEKGLDPLVESFSEIPNIGLTREQNAKLLRAYDTFVDVQKTSREYQVVLAEGMGTAVQKTMEELASIAKRGDRVDSVRDLMKLWVNIADRTFMDLYATQRYQQVQIAVSTAGMKHRLAQREVLEMILNHFNLPTRTELDDAYKTIYELKKEVKALKKSMAGQDRPKTRAGGAKRPARKQSAGKKKASARPAAAPGKKQ